MKNVVNYLEEAKEVLKKAGFAATANVTDWKLLVEIAKMLQQEELKK